MKITYYQKGDTVVGIGETNLNAVIKSIPGGYATCVFILANCTSTEKKQLLNTTKFISHAKPHGDDDFDFEIGKSIVREKLLIKEAERDIQRQAIVEKYLRRAMDENTRRSYRSASQMANSYEALEEF